MAIDVSAALLGDLLAPLSTSIPSGTTIRAYTGSPPGIANAATGSLLWTYTFGAGPWAAVSGVTRSFAGVPLTANASGAGTAGYVRVENAGDTTKRFEGTAGTSGTDFIFDSVNWTSGQSVSLNSFTFTAGDLAP